MEYFPLKLIFTAAAVLCLLSCHGLETDDIENLQRKAGSNHGNHGLDAMMGVGTEMDEEEEGIEEGGGDEEVDEERVDVEEDTLNSLRSVNSLDDFLSLLHKENGERITPDDIFSKYESEDGKRVIHAGGRLAVPDECSPRNTTVYLQMNGTDSRDIFFPRCTRVERCGGCCPTPHLKCVSDYTERISLMVVKARASRPGSQHLVFNGIAPVVVDRHILCRVRCMLSPGKCGRKKTFLANQCICKCRRYRRCMAPQVFNSDTCECECPGGKRECCTRPRHKCGYFFNKRSCECDVYSGRDYMNDRNFTKESNDTADDTSPPEGKLGRVHMNNKHGDLVPPPPPALHTPTDDTATDGSRPKPCAGVLCPRTFRYIVYNGNCRCRPTGRFRRPRLERKKQTKAKNKNKSKKNKRRENENRSKGK